MPLIISPLGTEDQPLCTTPANPLQLLGSETCQAHIIPRLKNKHPNRIGKLQSAAGVPTLCILLNSASMTTQTHVHMVHFTEQTCIMRIRTRHEYSSRRTRSPTAFAALLHLKYATKHVSSSMILITVEL